MRITDKYVFFWGEEFSQWHPCDFTDPYGVTYNCAEQYMMAGKAWVFQDGESYKKIMEARDPGVQKKLGRKVERFDHFKWEERAWDIVYMGNYLKFTQSKKLLKTLLDTDNKILVEASPYDKIWGIGLEENDERCLDRLEWEGKNWLGHALTRLKESLAMGEAEADADFIDFSTFLTQDFQTSFTYNL